MQGPGEEGGRLQIAGLDPYGCQTLVSSGTLHLPSLESSVPESWSNLKSNRVSMHGYGVHNYSITDFRAVGKALSLEITHNGPRAPFFGSFDPTGVNPKARRRLQKVKVSNVKQH